MGNENTLKDLIWEKINALDHSALAQISYSENNFSYFFEDDDDIECSQVEYDSDTTSWNEQFWAVYKIERGDEVVFVRFNGYYESYYGARFEKWFFVEPITTTKTKYKRI